MSDRILVDTNVLVYAYDRSEPAKQVRAIEVLDHLAVTRSVASSWVLPGRGVISTQVLAEFFVAITRKIAAPLSVSEACERVQNYLQSWPVIELTGMIVMEAARGVRDHQLSFWDAQVWATAKLNQLPVVFSEDFNTGEVLEGVRFVNPFADDFRIADWS